MTINDLSPEQLRKAASIKEQIVGLEKQLQALLSGNTLSVKPVGGGISEATRAKIAAAAKARWAKVKAGKAPAASPAKKTMSAAAKAKISAAAKARWAKIRAAKGK